MIMGKMTEVELFSNLNTLQKSCYVEQSHNHNFVKISVG